MSNEVTTADKKIAGKKTVKKKAARSVVVSPVSVKASGKSAVSKELTAPIGLVWNEDTDKASRKSSKTTGRTASKQPERPMITGTGWPDRPPAPKVNKPGPIQYKASTAGKKETAGTKSGSARTGQKAGDKKSAAKEEPVTATQTVKGASTEEELDALMESVSKGQAPVRPKQISEQEKQTGPEGQQGGQQGGTGGQQGTQQGNPGQQPGSRQGRPGGQQGRQQARPGQGRPPANRQNPAGQRTGNPMKQGGVLYSPVTQGDARTPISPMQKRPANTQVWEGPIRAIPGYGDSGYGPKFVRTVVTTTTTTYEPVTEDVIRQITSQTSPVALTDSVLNQPPAMPPLPGQHQQAVNQQQAQGWQQAGGQRTQGRPGQGRPQTGQRPQGQQARPGQARPPVNSQYPQGQQAPGQKQSIIGTMESKGPGNTQHTGMTQQFAEIEKALGLTSDPANANPANGNNNDALTEAIINNAGVNPANGQGLNNQGPNGNTINNPPGNTPGMPGPAAGPVQAGGPAPAEQTEARKSSEYMMLFIEGIIFLIVLAICISIFTKIKKGNKVVDTSSDTAIEETQPETEENTGDEGTEDFEVEDAGSEDIIEGDQDLMDPGSGDEATTTAPSGSVDVDNDRFTLRCTNVTVKLDTDGNPAALIYFSFTNKTSEQKAVADVFPISVTQNGEPCDTYAALDEYPEEYYNKDMQVADGTEISCAYAVSLKDAISPLVLTVHDNSTGELTDVGSTEIALQ